jgi:hypothetical protein
MPFADFSFKKIVEVFVWTFSLFASLGKQLLRE